MARRIDARFRRTALQRRLSVARKRVGVYRGLLRSCGALQERASLGDNLSP